MLELLAVLKQNNDKNFLAGLTDPVYGTVLSWEDSYIYNYKVKTRHNNKVIYGLESAYMYICKPLQHELPIM